MPAANRPEEYLTAIKERRAVSYACSTSLQRAEALGDARGPYALQAALAACHARARRPEDTDWTRIAELYDVLREVAPSPVVDLNRAVAHSMAFGPEAGLALVDAIEQAEALRDYAPLPPAIGPILSQRGGSSSTGAPFRARHLTRLT